jgi:hypothetical protein
MNSVLNGLMDRQYPAGYKQMLCAGVQMFTDVNNGCGMINAF